MNGALVLIKCLEKHGVDIVFGIPGGAVLKLYDEINKSSIEHILTRHEQGAVHAADAYNRVTGKVGVCIGTSGPGAANLVTGLGNASLDSAAVIAITGQVGQSVLGKDAFQEINTVGLSQPVTKHNYIVRSAKEIPKIVEEAFTIASNGRPGPVLIDIPKDVFVEQVDDTLPLDVKVALHIQKKFTTPVATDEEITKVIELLNKSAKPVILIGNGVTIGKDAPKYLLDLVDNTDLLVTTTLHGKSSFPISHPNAMGMLGMHGTFVANYAVQNCDLLLNVGSRFDDRITCKVEGFLPNAKEIIHVDISDTEHNKNVASSVTIHSDSEIFLKKMLQRKSEIKNVTHSAWRKEVFAKDKKLSEKASNGIHPITVSKKICSNIDDATYIVTDVGQHQMFAALYMHVHKPRHFVSSGGLGTMGFGLPAAIGVAFANRSAKTFLITGDGSFPMTMQELALLDIYKLNIKVIIYDNQCLGMVRQWQEMFYNKNYSHSQYNYSPNWDKLAETYNLPYYAINQQSDIDSLDSVLNEVGPAIIMVNLENDANVFPMVAPFETLNKTKGE